MCGIGIYTWHEDPDMDREYWIADVTDRDEARRHALLALRNDPNAKRVLVADAGKIIIDYVQ
jgi:hypothetical protein